MGILDSIMWEKGRLTFFGWLFHPRRPATRLRLFVNGKEVDVQPPASRPDVGRMFPWVSHSQRSGYVVSLPSPASRGRIDILGEQDKGPLFYWSSFFRDDLDDLLPSPPEALAKRVAGYSGEAFKLRGLKIFTDLFDQIDRHGMRSRPPVLLDWGSGCGSVSVHLRDLAGDNTFAADVDGEAISWARSALPGIHFSPISPAPPLDYREQQFDLIVASSVFTHLPRGLQNRWLQELRRILAPDGLVLASVHGDFSLRHIAAAVPSEPWRSRRRKWRLRLEYFLKGISDSSLDSSFQQVLPEGFYRTVLQSEAYTRRTWQKFLPVVDYIPRGLAGLQDLVVLRREA